MRPRVARYSTRCRDRDNRVRSITTGRQWRASSRSLAPSTTASPLSRPSGTNHRVKARVERPHFNRRYGHFGNRRRTPAPPHVPIPWRRRAARKGHSSNDNGPTRSRYRRRHRGSRWVPPGSHHSSLLLVLDGGTYLEPTYADRYGDCHLDRPTPHRSCMHRHRRRAHDTSRHFRARAGCPREGLAPN